MDPGLGFEICMYGFGVQIANQKGRATERAAEFFPSCLSDGTQNWGFLGRVVPPCPKDCSHVTVESG